MKYFLAVLCFLLLGVSVFKLVQGSDSDAPQDVTPEAGETQMISVEAYSYATSATQKNGAVFATIKNLGVEHLSGKDLVISKAESNVAERIELHTHMMDDGVMMMREVPQFDLPANAEITLKPAGDHIMLFGLNRQLMAGETFPMTVFIGDGYSHGYGGVTFDVKVISAGEKP